jgi:AMP deaminase
VEADAAARNHQRHPGLPHEQKGSLLASEGIHGAGAGVGVGAGAGGFVDNDSSITAELSAIYTNIRKVLDLRHKYIRLSLQGADDNPKDDPRWNIYPPPPEPVWEEEKARGTSGRESMTNSGVLNTEVSSLSPL